jgi:hypothetical protein
VRLLFTFAGNEGHLQPMRYLVLSPFPPSKGDHADPLGPTTHFFQFDQEPRLSAASSLLDQLAGRPTLTDASDASTWTPTSGSSPYRSGIRMRPRRRAQLDEPVAAACVLSPTMTRALRVGCLWQRGCDLRWRPFPGGSCDGDEEYHFDEASE